MSHLQEYARSVLFANTLEGKLAGPPGGLRALLRDGGPNTSALDGAPQSPPRPEGLARFGRSDFPTLKALETDVGRAQALHFFANHELQAVELMALALLRFPEAPQEFRNEVAATLVDEQEHMRLYIARIEELGLAFGDLPVSDYFWRAMRGMRSPQDYVVHVSLTFEQANLDYSRSYQRAMQTIGDDATAAVLERVYEDEIRHVRLGVRWFNRWRDPSVSDWEAYKSALRPPMTPRRGRGEVLDIEGRTRAGLSSHFVREMKVCTASRGRPPTLWWFDPFFETRVARRSPGWKPKRKLRHFGADLQHLPMFLSKPGDLIAVEKRPALEWLERMAEVGLPTPKFVELAEGDPWKGVTDPHLTAVQPWGWDPESHRKLAPLRDLLPAASTGREILSSDWDPGFRSPLAAKDFACGFLRGWLTEHPELHDRFGPPQDCGVVCETFERVSAEVTRMLAAGVPPLLKAPLDTAGHGLKRVVHLRELEGSLGGWIRAVLAEQDRMVVEHYYDKVCDLSAQIHIDSAQPARLVGVRCFVTQGPFAYAGTLLGGTLRGADDSVRRFVQDERTGVLKSWQSLLNDLGDELTQRGYQGPVGVDAMVHRLSNGSMRLHPMLEINTRWTLGRVALALEDFISPSKAAFWGVIPRSRWPSGDPPQWCEALVRDDPPSLDARGLLQEGVVITSDPTRVREAITLLAVGQAIESVRRLCP